MGRPQCEHFRGGREGRQAGWSASLPRTTRNKQGRCSVPWPYSPSSWETGLREDPCWDTVDVLQEKGSICPGSSEAHSLLPPLWTCLRGVCKSQHAPACSTPEVYAKELASWDAPCQTPPVCKPHRERSPAGTYGLGNDEVANHQVGGGTHGAFWTPVTLPGIP